MARGKPIHAPNGYGTVVKLSGRRRCPYEVRVNTRINEWGMPVYDVLGRFSERTDATIALAKYNDNPYDVSSSSITFAQVYERWYKHKYEDSKKKFSQSTIYCTKGAYTKCRSLHDRKFKELRTGDFQAILDDHNLSHAYMEHIKNLFSQICTYAIQYDIVEKDYSKFAKITKEDDDTPGVPFTKEEIRLLWKHVDTVPFVDSILIYIYSGWRCAELLTMDIKDIDNTNWTFRGGLKNKSSRNRIVPIHTLIRPYIARRLSEGHCSLFASNGKPITYQSAYMKLFRKALAESGIATDHTPHDARHTFTSLLDSAGANEVCIDRMLGHASKGITKNTYTHKDIKELRGAVELLKKEP